MSLFTPKFISELSRPDVQSVFLTGCGGGFDFVHSTCMIPEIKRLGKSFVIGSYSFGDPAAISAEICFTSTANPTVIAKKVYATSQCSAYYCPEVAICQFLDSEFPSEAPHFVYAYYARDFAVVDLSLLLNTIISLHSIDAVLLFDGGSDSLMRGDENGLGDPVEDSTSIASVASLSQLKFSALIDIGLGTDRFIDVSDCASLRAVAEISRMGGFLGSVSLQQNTAPFDFYRRCVESIYSRQGFRSVLAGSIIAAAEGYFAGDEVPEHVRERVRKGGLFVWPIMAVLWGFDVRVVAERSWVVKWIKDAANAREANWKVDEERRKLREMGKIRDVEELPRHVDYSVQFMDEREKDGGRKVKEEEMKMRGRIKW
jgi:hypothetical protein